MKDIKYILYKEGEYFVSQCLNVDVSSFGSTIEEATSNLKEALELYFDLFYLSKYKKPLVTFLCSNMFFNPDRVAKSISDLRFILNGCFR